MGKNIAAFILIIILITLINSIPIAKKVEASGCQYLIPEYQCDDTKNQIYTVNHGNVLNYIPIPLPIDVTKRNVGSIEEGGSNPIKSVVQLAVGKHVVVHQCIGNERCLEIKSCSQCVDPANDAEQRTCPDGTIYYHINSINADRIPVKDNIVMQPFK